MNKKWMIATIVAFVVWMAGDFAVHGVWLASRYMALGALYRPEADQMQYLPWMIGAHVLMAGGVAWIYGRGVNSSPWMGQGVRFGLAMSFVMGPTYLIYYSIQPLPRSLVAMQGVGCGVTMILLGLAMGFMHKDGSKA